jgi:hypothetical protein
MFGLMFEDWKQVLKVAFIAFSGYLILDGIVTIIKVLCGEYE